MQVFAKNKNSLNGTDFKATDTFCEQMQHKRAFPKHIYKNKKNQHGTMKQLAAKNSKTSCQMLNVIVKK